MLHRAGISYMLEIQRHAQSDRLRKKNHFHASLAAMGSSVDTKYR
jgi:hypothetical protein